MDRRKAGGRSGVRMSGAIAPPRTRLSLSVEPQVPWIEILGYYRASRGTVLDLKVKGSRCCDGRHRGRP